MSKIFLLMALFINIGLRGQELKKVLSMDEAVSIGLKSNPEILAAAEKINAVSGRFWNGISLPAPELSFSYEYVPTGKVLNSAGEKSAEISQSMEFPTNYFLKGSRLNKEILLAEKELELTELSVISKIKSAYFTLLMRRKQLDLAIENLTIAEDFSKKAEVRYEVGEGTNLERLTAKVQFAEARNSVETQKNLAGSAAADLNYLLGAEKYVTINYELADSLVFEPVNIGLELLVNYAEEMNPEIIIGRLKVELSSLDRKLAWSGLLPNLNFAYFKQTLDGNNGYYGASFSISLPLWFMFDQKGKIQEADANFSISEYEQTVARNKVILNIRNAYAGFRNEEKQVMLYQTDILPEAEEIYRSALKSYEEGEITYLEFLQAKQIVVNARSNYINALLGYNLSIAALEAAAGKSLNQYGDQNE